MNLFQPLINVATSVVNGLSWTRDQFQVGAAILLIGIAGLVIIQRTFKIREGKQALERSRRQAKAQ